MPASPSRIPLRVGFALSLVAGIMLLAHILASTLPNAQIPPGSSTDTPGPPRIFIGFRNDDVNASSDPTLEAAVLSVFRKHRIPQTFSVIPNPGGLTEREAEQNLSSAPILDSLLAWHAAGDISYAIHGYRHLKEPRSGGEFDGLPLEEQTLRLQNGKRLLDRYLKTSVTMFAPPWNQADENTILACRAVGITTFCGYEGETPTEGVTLVNTNAVLFQDPGYVESAHGLPSLEELLPCARTTTDTVFLLVFYHSRRDFMSADRFAALDRILSSLAQDSLVTILGIDEMARRYPRQLAEHNAAGLALLQIDEAEDALKLTNIPFSWLYRLTGSQASVLTRKQHALESYRRGEYLRANIYGGEAIKALERQRMWGRLIIAAVLGGLALLIAYAASGTRKGAIRVILDIVPFAGAACIAVLLVFLNLAHTISSIRTSDLTVLGTMTAIALLIGGTARSMRENHS